MMRAGEVLLAAMLTISPMRVANDPRLVVLEVTAYTLVECNQNNGITASGVRVQQGMCAAPRGVPFGTRVYVPRHGWLTVTDRGGAIRGRRLDVFRDSYSEALQMGRRRVVVQVWPGLEWPE